MQRLIYWLVLAISYPVSLLPFAVLYVFADAVAFVLQHVFAYRRDVMLKNLSIAFPEKSNDELHIILKECYRSLADISMEQLKMLSVAESTIHKRLEFVNFELAEKFFREGKSVVCVMGHSGNWEYSVYTKKKLGGLQPYAIYRPLKNPYYDRLIYKVRSRFGMGLLSMARVQSFFKQKMDPKQYQPFLTVFAADQSPAVPKRAWWTHFLNHDTAFFMGPELIARRYKLPVVWLNIIRTSRGHYRMEMQQLTDDASQSEVGQITEMQIAELEKLIHAHPGQWLWSHRRWKHKRPEGARGKQFKAPANKAG